MLAAAALPGLLHCAPATHPDLAFQRGLNAGDQGRFDWARIYFAEDLESHPDRAEAWRRAGLAWSSGRQQSPTEAIEHFRHYLSLRPEDGEIQLRLARAHFTLGQWDEAQAWAERLGAGLEADMLRAEVFLDVDAERARRAMEDALAAAADDPRVQALAARVYDRLGEPQVALAHARRAVELAPLDARSRYLLARLHQQLGEPEQAAAAFAVHELLAPLVDRGSVAKLSPAEELRLMRRLEPEVASSAPDFRRALTRLLVQTGHRSEASAELAARLEGSPPPGSEERLELARLAEQNGEEAVARELFESLTDDAEAGREGRLGLARLALRNSNSGRARELLEEGLAGEPFLARYHYLLAQVALAEGRMEEAEGRLSRALELAPWDAEARVGLADLFLSQGRRDAAETLVAEAPEETSILRKYRSEHGFR